MADTETKFSEKIGWFLPEMGGRTARYAMVIDHGKVTYAEKEPGREIGVSAPHPLSCLCSVLIAPGFELRRCASQAIRA